ncbi:MAG: aminoacyl-tRNA hydrolase [Desulfobacterales bacterium]|nr:aminoacyl-tRNA hydrolase [Desulfobacterales bacterium]
MIRITDDICIERDEIQMDFVRASGPGGQNVNKVATAVQLRFDVKGSPSLPEDVRRRLIGQIGSRLTNQGALIIQARGFRTQERNRQDALERLTRIIRAAVPPPKPRRKTRPSRGAVQRRLNVKKRRSNTKRGRRSVSADEE